MVTAYGAIYGLRFEPDNIPRGVPDRLEQIKMQIAEFHYGIHLIQDKVIIRIPTDEEKEEYDSTLFMGQEIGLDFIIEVNEDDQVKCWDTIYRTVFALRLHKGDRLVFRYFAFKERDSKKYVIIEMRGPIGMITYQLHHNEIEYIRNILNKLYKFDFKKYPHYRIAYDRFNKSYNEEAPEDKILDLCISLEALFCQGEYSDFKGKTIGIGCSMLLGQNYSERASIRNCIIEAFTHRNDVVHGDTYDIENIVKILSSLDHYLRRSILELMP